MKKKTIDFIEVSIIILIIIGLSVVSLYALESSRARAKDARRVAEVRLIQSALALYRHDAGNFPQKEDFISGEPLVYSDTIYLDIIPFPPTSKGFCLNASEYTYNTQIASNGLTSYTLEYCLESETAGISPGINTASPSGIRFKD